ncbi:MAG: NYN domain-containing protein [Lachnospira sp.]
MGLLAHVDAGKTTLSEALLYTSGAIRKPGRVDNKDAFLDNYEYERQRGITIFSKQAVFQYKDMNVTLLDTPGHVDFSAEMERTLWILDVAVLVINGADGVQGHTKTLWKLLSRLSVPVFIFVNKMDQQGTDRKRLLTQINNTLSGSSVDFNYIDYEEIAVNDEEAMESFLADGVVTEETIRRMISERKIFPVYFGSALKMTGVKELLDGLELYATAYIKAGVAEETDGADSTDEADIIEKAFGARVYKISRDARGERLTHLKVTRGVLKNKMFLGDEKINQIRIYSGEKYVTVNEVSPGNVCAVTGPENTKAGQGIGVESFEHVPVISPVLSYKLNLPANIDAAQMLPKMRMLEEENPELNIEWNENFKEIHVSVMGPVLIEVLQKVIKERFDVDVSFGEGSIVYKETIADKVEGIGHFEPLRHYAEVHLIMEPAKRGSGIIIETDCSEDVLDKNWQRLIYTHLCEKRHVGVLTGSALTDVKITLVTGRAHNKHTEGGDFRQATYRAVRQGLMQARSVLLEPYYSFEITLSQEYVGKAMTDLERMGARFSVEEARDLSGTDESGNTHSIDMVVKGEAPVSCIGNYQAEINAYTRGTGSIALRMSGYGECHNSDEVIEKFGYDPLRDTRNPVDSVFCGHGSGYVVPWNEVSQHCHVECVLETDDRQDDGTVRMRKLSSLESARTVSKEWIGTEEIDKILQETYFRNSRGDNERRQLSKRNVNREVGHYVNDDKNLQNDDNVVLKSYEKPVSGKAASSIPNYLLVDGYNVIHAWDELKSLAEVNMDSARGRLLDILCNYQAMKKCELIVVFDAYRVAGHREEFTDFHNIHVVYTKQAETADHYIEKFAHENAKKYNITVVTSDGLEQIIIRGEGCYLLSSRDFCEEVNNMENYIREQYLTKTY